MWVLDAGLNHSSSLLRYDVSTKMNYPWNDKWHKMVYDGEDA